MPQIEQIKSGQTCPKCPHKIYNHLLVQRGNDPKIELNCASCDCIFHIEIK